jgi:hypothetical protein
MNLKIEPLQFMSNLLIMYVFIYKILFGICIIIKINAEFRYIRPRDAVYQPIPQSRLLSPNSG